MAKLVNVRTTNVDDEVPTAPENPTTPTEDTKDPTTPTEEEEADPTYPDRIERWGFLTGIATRKWVRKLVEKLSGGTSGDGGVVGGASITVDDVEGLDLTKYATKDELTSTTKNLATKTELSGYVPKAQYDELAARVQALESALNG